MASTAQKMNTGIEAKLQDSGEWMRALLEGSSDMIQVVDEHGVLKYVSPSMKHILGHNPADPIGDSAFKIIHPDDMAEVQRVFGEVLHNPHIPAKTICRCMHADGSWRYIEALAKNQLDNPVVRGIILNIRDITEHVEAKEMMRESEETFRSITEQWRDGIVVIDHTGTILVYNEAQEKLSGISASEAIGTKLWEIQYRCMPEDRRAQFPYAKFKKMQSQLCESGYIGWIGKVMEIEIQRPDRSRVFMQTTVYPIRLKAGMAYASFGRDVSELRAAEKAVKNREIELSEQNELLQQKNIALREVMGQVEEEKKKINGRIGANVEHLIMPIIAKLKMRTADNAALSLVEMLEENLGDITSEFGQQITEKMHNLTQREIEICDMIKNGLSSKEIARLLYISPRTIDAHRNRIRKKLGIKDEQVNITTFLKSRMKP
jgi:PAS domain S-box-containing protein